MDYQGTFYSGGRPLPFILSIPDDKDVEQKFPAVVLCHGHSRYYGDGLDKLAAKLVENGIASLRFDFSGCGERALRRYHLYCASQWPQDLSSAVSFLRKFSQIDSDRVGVAGISMGACTALYQAGVDSRIKSVVSMAGIADCGSWLEGVWQRSNGDWPSFYRMLESDHTNAAVTGESRIVNVLEMYNESDEAKAAVVAETLVEPDINAYVSLDSLYQLVGYRPIEHCPGITCDALILHGESDTLVPIENAKTIFNAIPAANKKLHVYEGIDHNIPRHERRDMVFEDIVTWFTNSL